MAPWVGGNHPGPSGFSSSLWRPGYSYVSPAASSCAGAGAGCAEPYAECKKDAAARDPVVKAWAGEQIHEECPTDDTIILSPQDLELKL